jgi:putative addiction module component (TIGR02574 family)
VELHCPSHALIGTLDQSGAVIYFGGDKTMSATLEQIEREALALPAKERSQLVDKLWESLGDTTYPVLSKEWLAEIERRRQELLQGKVKPIPGEEVSRKAWEMAKSTRS